MLLFILCYSRRQKKRNWLLLSTVVLFPVTFLLSQVLNCGTISCQTCTNMTSMMFPLLCFSWFWVSTTGSPTRRCSQQQLSWAGGWRHWVNVPKTTLPFSARREPSGSSRPRPASCTTSAVSPPSARTGRVMEQHLPGDWMKGVVGQPEGFCGGPPVSPVSVPLQ